MKGNKRSEMNEKIYKSWSKFHRMGKIKFSLMVLPIYIVMGNIATIVDNILESHIIMLTLRQAITTSIFWFILGIFVCNIIWKSSEKQYYNYINKHINKNL